ncbi:addiction module protein [Nostoc sp. CHAB 5836]|uniref:addiction module protein n=1 Tax=Nostoc sp. CHAB 5836 TaxID=2780404 RepID=UPI001E5C60B1|nr:addiction module protein [Nostoc sp. CHAB 5836]MCC5614517.1 addiction module protein [Nostoc sp. CHAB 5836]
MVSVEQVMKEALALPSAARALLAEKLVESLEFDVDETLQTLWTNEAKKRRDEVRSGAIKPIPGEEALARIRQLLE